MDVGDRQTPHQFAAAVAMAYTSADFVQGGDAVELADTELLILTLRQQRK